MIPDFEKNDLAGSHPAFPLILFSYLRRNVLFEEENGYVFMVGGIRGYPDGTDPRGVLCFFPWTCGWQSEDCFV